MAKPKIEHVTDERAGMVLVRHETVVLAAGARISTVENETKVHDDCTTLVVLAMVVTHKPTYAGPLKGTPPEAGGVDTLAANTEP